MQPTLELRLYRRFKRLYSVSRGVLCGDGWFDVLWSASLHLESQHARNQHIGIGQVREKAGVMMIRLTSLRDEVAYNIVHAYSELSTHTCEKCGAPGVRRGCGYWIKTVCDEHYTDLMLAATELEQRYRTEALMW